MLNENHIVCCSFLAVSVALFGIGGWQFHEYQSKKSYENSLSWQVCNTTSWRIVNSFDGMLDITTTGGACSWKNVPLFSCQDVPDGPLQCLRAAENKYRDVLWSCVTAKETPPCAHDPPFLQWPDTKYQFSMNIAIVVFVLGSIALLFAGCYMYALFCQKS